MTKQKLAISWLEDEVSFRASYELIIAAFYIDSVEILKTLIESEPVDELNLGSVTITRKGGGWWSINECSRYEDKVFFLKTLIIQAGTPIYKTVRFTSPTSQNIINKLTEKLVPVKVKEESDHLPYKRGFRTRMIVNNYKKLKRTVKKMKKDQNKQLDQLESLLDPLPMKKKQRKKFAKLIKKLRAIS